MSTVNYGTPAAVVSDRPSPIIWKDCPVNFFANDPSKGFHVFEDFFEAPGATTVGGSRWYSYVISGGNITLSDAEKGVVVLDHNDSDNDDTVITTGDNTTGLITPADGSANKWWFEARFAVATITTDDIGIFIGLTEEGQAADGKPMTDATAVVNDIDHVGFNVLAADGAALNFVWNLSGQTAQTTAGVQTLVAGTFYRVGMKYTPIDNKVHVFVDGVENVDAAFLMSNANAPADTLAVTAAIKGLTNAGAADTLSIDWIRYSAEYSG